MSQNCKLHEISNDFARCFVPIRHLNDSQDGALTTIWPRKLILSTPGRPKLPIPSASSLQSPTSATFKEDRTRAGTGAPLYLTSLSFRSNPSIANLSSSLGIYVDSAMKERERPKPDPSRPIQASTSYKQAGIPETAPFSLVSQPLQHVQPMEIVPQGNLAPAPAQSYPSPLEMMAIRANVNPDVVSNDPPPSSAQNLQSNQPPIPDGTPAEAPRVDDSSTTAQSQFSASHTAMDPWDSGPFGMGNFGFPDTPGMGFNPFSSTSMAQDDFNFNLFDIPTVPPESTEMDPPSVSQPHDANANSLPDMILALANQATEGEYAKLDSSLIQWHDSDGSGPFPSISNLETSSALLTEAAQIMQPSFTLDAFGNLIHSSGLVDASSSTAVIPLLSEMTLNAEIVRENDEEMAESESGFLALRFGKDHHLADEKYSSGKYSLPSPPPDRTDSRPPLSRLPSLYKKRKEDLDQKSNSSASPVKSSTAREGELRDRYLTATNPSRAVLVKLAGTKRNWDIHSILETYGSPEAYTNGPLNSEIPVKKRRLTWGSTDETWRSPTPPREQNEDDDEDADTSLAGDEDWEVDMNAAVDESELNGSIDWHKFDIFTQQQDPIRLLQASFNFLLIKEQELASPVDMVLPDISIHSTRVFSTFQMPAPVSVPTPVSPEALPGGNDASAHISTKVASQIARQMCFNTLWRAAANATGTLDATQLFGRKPVSPSEVIALVRILRGAPIIQWGKSVSEICVDDEDSVIHSPMELSDKPVDRIVEHVEPLYPPRIYIGQGTSVIESLPSIARFWNQVNITPLHGIKDTHAIALISDEGGTERIHQAEAWLEKLGKVYGSRRFGSHTPFRGQKNPKGVVPIRWENFRTVCDRLVLEKTKQTQSLIVYVIVPNTFTNFSHPSASHVIGVIADVNETNGNTPGRLLFHLIPEIFVFHSATLSHTKDFEIERLALSVYDSIPHVVERQYSRLSNKVHQPRESNDAHAFTLATRRPNKPNFVESWPPPIATMFDQYAFLHIAYDISADCEWVVAAVVTESGEGTQTRVWKVDDNELVSFTVKSVLDFALKEARKANVEWRVTISKNGPMLAPEVDAWTSELANLQAEQSIHLTLLCLTTQESPFFMALPQLSPLPPAPLLPGRYVETQESTILIDNFADAFLMFPSLTGIAPSLARSIEKGDFISNSSPHGKADLLDMVVTPFSTCWVVYLLRHSDWSQAPEDGNKPVDLTHPGISGFQIHALHFACFGNSTYTSGTQEHMRDIATSFHDLTILGNLRRGIGDDDIGKPLHFSHVDAMKLALGGLKNLISI